MLIVEILLLIAAVYLLIGFLFAIWFAAIGITKFDNSAKGTGVFFRVIVFFGAMAFWILLLKRILQDKQNIEVTAHRI